MLRLGLASVIKSEYRLFFGLTTSLTKSVESLCSCHAQFHQNSNLTTGWVLVTTGQFQGGLFESNNWVGTGYYGVISGGTNLTTGWALVTTGQFQGGLFDSNNWVGTGYYRVVSWGTNLTNGWVLVTTG